METPLTILVLKNIPVRSPEGIFEDFLKKPLEEFPNFSIEFLDKFLKKFYKVHLMESAGKILKEFLQEVLKEALKKI